MKHLPSLFSRKYVSDFIHDAAPKAPRKRLFIGLITGTSVLLCLFLLAGWIIPVVGLGNIHPSIPYITGFLLAACIGVIAWTALSMVLQIATGRKFRGSSRMRGLANRFLLPCMELVARLVGISADEVRRSFIKVNNELSRNLGPVFTPENIVILLPHCLQRTDCEVRLTSLTDACKRCGRCPIAGLLSLRDQYGVRLAIATGGSIARRIVVDIRPRLIIAVACERDLTSGIQDTHPLPVYGILNHRPQGPCHNTTLSLSLVENALRHFIIPEKLPLATIQECP
ncbi:MAG: DUF116 domain-containing protein [Desulfovibrio sp.]|nr:DUF116 domain-containing protein [Desulfovibrio sp.]